MHRRPPQRARFASGPLLHGRGSIASLALGAAVALVAPAAFAADPQPGGQPSFAPPEEDNGIERPFAPDQRTGHFYLSPTFTMVGPVGYAGPNVPFSSLAGLGYSVGGILGIGVSRHATIQIFGERSAFESPGNCRLGCYGWSYSLGVGVTYHLAQGLAFDPWGSFGIAYRRSTFYAVAPSTAMVDGKQCTEGALCAQGYGGLDVARIAFGGDWYPVPWFGFGPYVEVDAGTNLGRPYVTPAMALPPTVTDGPKPYAFFHLGIRVAFDPLRRGSLPRGHTPPASPATPPSATPAAASVASPAGL